jgi:tetratricopeptide (TPR) repeat protein
MAAGEVLKIKWFQSLSFLGLVGLTLVPLLDLGGIFAVMRFKGRDLVLEESARLMEQTGNNVVTRLGQRSQQIEALCRSEASVAESLPRDPNMFHNVFPPMLNFAGDLAVAGGGVWPEPGAFTPGVERRSFFWGRDDKGSLVYFDDYNTGARGYHKDEWYPVVRYSRPGNCFWSKSYMDPYSYQPMVTCTVGMWDKNKKFSGVATIDLKLEGLHDFMKEMQKQTGGYVFLLDRNNKFLTFPDVEEVQIIGKDDKGKITKEFMTIAQFAEKQPLFKPIADAVNAMNKDILDRAKTMRGYKPDLASRIDNDSDQIDAEEAEFISAVIADPLDELTKNTNLYKSFDLKRDYRAKESAIVYLFHVPQSYWKVVAVKPLSEAGAVASAITWVLMIFITVTILAGILFAVYMGHRFFTKPLRTTTAAVLAVGEAVAERKFDELESRKIKEIRPDELGQLSQIVNSLASEVQSSYGSLVELNQNLERKVEDRTRELQTTLNDVSELKRQQDGDYFLTSLLIKPLAVNRAESDRVTVEFLLKQKKKFEFKHKSEELGGDICLADTITLKGRKFTVFINGDAMGKSIQGAGGALVLGAVSRMIIERTRLSSALQDVYPERWMKNAFIEFQKMFESFDGSMLVSLVLGLVDDESGVLYHINAEHPFTVLFRKGRAGFIETQLTYRKLGIGGIGGSVHVRTIQLEPGDVIIAGSDGRDDLLLPGTAGRVINDDEMKFLQHVEGGGGDLNRIYENILESGEITDDLSLVRVVYKGGPAGPEPDPELLSSARTAFKSGERKAAVEMYEQVLTVSPLHDEAARRLIKIYLDDKDYEKAAAIAQRLADSGKIDPEFSYAASLCVKRTGDLRRAADMGERTYIREPGHVKNLVNLADIYLRLNNTVRASEFLERALKAEPDNAMALRLKEKIEAV